MIIHLLDQVSQWATCGVAGTFMYLLSVFRIVFARWMHAEYYFGKSYLIYLPYSVGHLFLCWIDGVVLSSAECTRSEVRMLCGIRTAMKNSEYGVSGFMVVLMVIHASLSILNVALTRRHIRFLCYFGKQWRHLAGRAGWEVISERKTMVLRPRWSCIGGRITGHIYVAGKVEFCPF